MLNGGEFIDQDAICARLKLHDYRVMLLIREGALPKPRPINGRTGWLWSEIQQSSFMREHDKWNPEWEELYGPRRVYIVKVGEYVKIGYSADVRGRIMEMQVSNPHAVELLYAFPGDEKIEDFLHYAFDHLHHRGEWFRMDKQISDFIEAHKNDPRTLPVPMDNFNLGIHE